MNDIADPGSSVFVGRAEEVRGAIAMLRNADEGMVWDVVGVHGIGKSELLKRVRKNAEWLGPEAAVLSVDMAGRSLEEGFRGDYGSNAGGAVLLATLTSSRKLMLACAEDFKNRLKIDVFDMFRNVCEKQRKEADAFEHQRGERSGPGARQWSSADRAQVREFQEAIDDAFVEAWETFTRRRQVLFTIDTFDAVAENELGHWIVRTALRLPRTLTMLARVPSTVGLAPGHPRMNRVLLPYFTLDEVGQCLSERVKVEQLKPGVAEAVRLYTDGHPGGVTLVAELIKEKGVDIEARALRRILDRLPDDPAEKWAELVRLVVAAVHDPLLQNAVDAASIVLSFDEPLLAHLLDVQKHEGYSAGDALRALAGYRLTQPVPGVGDRPTRHRLHEFIRLSLDAKLRVEEHTRWEDLHRGAADYYNRLLEQDEDAVGREETYATWYRYEKPEWQADKRQWLYHSGRLPARRHLTRTEFVLVFLQAFYWWGCYVPFDFNRRLLDDWELATVAWAADSTDLVLAEDQQLLDALWFLVDNYPVGYVKTAAAPWYEMRSALLLVRDLCGLSPDTRLPDDQQVRRKMARAQAMISIFLAHTCRFLDPQDDYADRYYAQAQRTFERLKDDTWIVPWLLFEKADLALERGRTEEALSLVRMSASRNLDGTLANEAGGKEAVDDDGFDLEEDEAVGDWDYELLANLYRARADVRWMREELAPAATDYGLAVSSAYWFQGIPGVPNEYTRQFYAEMTERAAERIIALAEADEGRAVTFAADLSAHMPSAPTDLTAAVRSRRLADIVAALFPCGPVATDLHSARSPFLDVWRRHRELYRSNQRPTPPELLLALVGAQTSE